MQLVLDEARLDWQQLAKALALLVLHRVVLDLIHCAHVVLVVVANNFVIAINLSRHHLSAVVLNPHPALLSSHIVSFNLQGSKR